ncbi:MAG: hypothetical protein AB2556_26205 [Candidatus Thiodiazotropha sp.]
MEAGAPPAEAPTALLAREGREAVGLVGCEVGAVAPSPHHHAYG